jgi:hypothetical protein
MRFVEDSAGRYIAHDCSDLFFVYNWRRYGELQSLL